MNANRTSHVPTAGGGLAIVAAMTLSGLATAACGQPSPQGARSPADYAVFMERTRCAPDDDDKTVASVLSGSAVYAVQPLYSQSGAGKSGPQLELRGATVSVAALPGVSAEWLDRALECYGAKATLGHTQTASDDPFWLPNAFIDIDVRQAKDGFDIGLTGFSPDDARRILARAKAFANSKIAPAKE
jgi:hypothetical protein